MNWVVKRYILIRIWCSNYLHCLKNQSHLFGSSSYLILSIEPKCCAFESISCFILAAIYLVYFFLQLYKRVKYPGYNSLTTVCLLWYQANLYGFSFVASFIDDKGNSDYGGIGQSTIQVNSELRESA